MVTVPEQKQTWLVTVDGRIKLCLLAAALLLNLAAGRLLTSAILGVLAAGLVLLAGTRPAALLRRLTVPMLLATVALFSQCLWVRTGETALQLPILYWSLTVTGDGLQHGAELAARILGGMSLLLCYTLTTPLTELIRTARFLRCPSVLSELLLIIYRYLFLLLEEGERIRNAQTARLGYTSFRSGLASSGVLGGMLLLRTYDRAERSMTAMRARGYQGALPGALPGPPTMSDWLALLAGGAVLLFLFAWR